MADWLRAHKNLGVSMPVDEKSTAAWLPHHAMRLVEMITELPHPVTFLYKMRLPQLIALGHAINCETQLQVIKLYAQDTKLAPEVRALCSEWATAADATSGRVRWKLTDDVDKWDRLLNMDPSLLGATVTKVVPERRWGVLNTLVVALPNLAPRDERTNVVMPQTKAMLYHNSPAVRLAVERILGKQPDWAPAFAVVRLDSSAAHRS
jgi:hypothetical protein